MGQTLDGWKVEIECTHGVLATAMSAAPRRCCEAALFRCAALPRLIPLSRHAADPAERRRTVGSSWITPDEYKTVKTQLSGRAIAQVAATIIQKLDEVTCDKRGT